MGMLVSIRFTPGQVCKQQRMMGDETERMRQEEGVGKHGGRVEGEKDYGMKMQTTDKLLLYKLYKSNLGRRTKTQNTYADDVRGV